MCLELQKEKPLMNVCFEVVSLQKSCSRTLEEEIMNSKLTALHRNFVVLLYGENIIIQNKILFGTVVIGATV